MKRLIFTFSLVFCIKMLVLGQIRKGVYTFEPKSDLESNLKFTRKSAILLTTYVCTHSLGFPSGMTKKQK